MEAYISNVFHFIGVFAGTYRVTQGQITNLADIVVKYLPTFALLPVPLHNVSIGKRHVKSLTLHKVPLITLYFLHFYEM